jgi:hypothetical protein
MRNYLSSDVAERHSSIGRACACVCATMFDNSYTDDDDDVDDDVDDVPYAQFSAAACNPTTPKTLIFESIL